MSARRSVPRRARPFRAFAWLNLLVVLALGGWYLAQPAARQEEVRTLWANYLARNKRIDLVDVVRDIWTLYYADAFVALERPAHGAPSPLFAGAPKPTTFAHSVRVLRNTGYTVGYSDALESPVWAAYRVWDLDRLPVPPLRPESFAVDRRTAARVQPADYSSSGYDRGHLAPNYAIATRFGVAAQEETFLMSNVVPQKHSLNAGLWKELEMRAATSYPARFREVWVLAGPVFGAHPAKLRGGVPVPEACWMVLLDEHEGGVRVLAFWFPQDAPADAPLARYLTSVDRIEAAIGFDLFPDLPAGPAAVLEAKTAERVW